jgi:Ino eighty subunit 2
MILVILKNILQIETIKRLLKKLSKPKYRGKTVLGDQTSNQENDNGDEVEVINIAEEPSNEVKPIMYRWFSSLRAVHCPLHGGRKVEMEISFSVPEGLFPSLINCQELSTTSGKQLTEIRVTKGPGMCGVEGQPRKYKVPRDWTIGACNSTHLLTMINRV